MTESLLYNNCAAFAPSAIENWRKDEMKSLVRISAVAGPVGCVVWMVGFLGGVFGLGDERIGTFLIGAGALLLMVSVAGIFAGSRNQPLLAGKIGLAITALGLVALLVQVAIEIFAIPGGQEPSWLWTFFIVGILCVLIGMSQYGVSAAWAGTAPVWSVLALVVGGGSTALFVLLTLVAGDALQRTAGDIAWQASTFLFVIFLTGWIVYGIAILAGKAPIEQTSLLSRARRVPAVALVVLVALAGLIWSGLGLFAPAAAKRVNIQPVTPAAARTIDPSARPVVIDTDMAPDDWLAILYLLQRGDVNVRAITVTGTGVAHCEPGVRHALGLVALAGYPAIPVACGSEIPYEGGQSFPDEWRRGADTLQGLALPAGGSANPALRAPQLLLSLADRNRGKLVVVALGPLTNLAQAIESEPEFAGKLGGIFIMGGAVDVPGNISPEEPGVAEWNIYADPRAASIVVESGAKVTLVPLDATNYVQVTPAFVEKLGTRRSTAVANFAYEVLMSNRAFVESGDYYFWDPMASAISTDETLATFAEMGLRVVVDGAEIGRTARAQDGSRVRVAVKADGARFEQLFLEALWGSGSR
jgi:pyrimidine-specific ribonucleoside hydrolase